MIYKIGPEVMDALYKHLPSDLLASLYCKDGVTRIMGREPLCDCTKAKEDAE